LTRLKAALPAVLTFAFGLSFGLVVGHSLWAGRQKVPVAMPEETDEEAPAQADAGQEGPSPEEVRKLLASHAELLKASPDDIRLLRSVGNYHAMLNEQDEALAKYAHAEEVARASGDKEALAQILTDQAVSLAEKGDIIACFAKIDAAREADPKDVRSRLTGAAILMVRVMPSPPPGWERKQVVARAENLLDEIDVLEPQNPYAREFREHINSVRQMMGRPRPDAPPGAAMPGGAMPGGG
jgi:hypothetical protein